MGRAAAAGGGSTGARRAVTPRAWDGEAWPAHIAVTRGAISRRCPPPAGPG